MEAEAELQRQRLPSRAAFGHLRDWADGTSSAVQVQYHMDNALQDGLDHVMVRELASVGSGGVNAHRGLMRWLDNKVGLTNYQTMIDSPDLVQRTTAVKERGRGRGNQRKRRGVCVCGGWVGWWEWLVVGVAFL